MAAFAITRDHSRKSSFFYTFFISGMMIPFHLYMFPLFRELKMFGMFGNFVGPIMIYISGSIAFGTLLYCSFLKGVPLELEEAAMLDGCGRAGLFFRIKVPMMLPTLSFIVFMAVKDALLICAPVMVMTEGGPARSTQTIVYYYYLSAFKNAAFSKAAAISMTVFVMAGILILAYKEFEKRRITYR